MAALTQAPPSSSLIPVRVDAATDDKSIRIVDTLLVDPTCWPIPLYAPLPESVERNVQELAHSILSEAEVTGMGRTVRHFTGRVELWSKALQTKIESQLRPQLWAIVNGTLPPPPRLRGRPIAISIRLVIHGVVIQEDIQWDPSVPLSPLEFATDLARDLKLPDEAVVSVVTTMLEQIYGLPVDPSPDHSVTPQTSQSRGAWRMDPKEHLTAVTHLVAQHRPA